MKVGFVNIFGKPNAGKSTLLNALMGEKLAIVSPKVQTTRHRIKGILNDKQYQIILSDTPGIIEPQYKLHDKMMKAVKGSLEDADLALLLVDLEEDWQDCDRVFSALRLKVPAIVLLNKLDRVTSEKIQEGLKFFEGKPYCKKAIAISALSGLKKKKFISEILNFLPEGEPYYNTDDISDLPSKFFVGELVREKIYTLYAQEIPYHTTVLVQEFREQPQLTRIRAEIIVQRESQKGIILGEGGKMIKKLGIQARKDIEDFLQQKVHLELFVKVRGKWRDDELYLKEYGYS